jgi:hypothetical protein
MGLSTVRKGSSPMIQPIRLQGRIPLLALIAVALATLVSISITRITTSAGTRTEMATSSVVAIEPVLAQRPIVQAPADKAACGAGAYVSGDLAGDASPAEIYAAMCGAR